jgi:hypothetical protein
MILHDWRCATHGQFEGSHPICPEMGCDSENVTKLFLKAPGIRSDFMKRHDAGIRKSAEMMGISNFRSARENEAAFGGDVGKPGERVLWGNEVNKVAGRPFAALTQQAEASNRFVLPTGKVDVVPSGMRQAGNSGITQRPLPQAERHVHKQDLAKAKA